MAVLDLTNRRSPGELDKLPAPTNEGLAGLFAGIDNVVFKDGGVYEDKAMTDKIVLTISRPEFILRLNELLQVDEQNAGFYCMCLGTYAIELYAGTALKATIGYHHGVSIRYHGWKGDAALANSYGLLHFLAELGFTKPLEDSIEEERQMEADIIAERNWFDAAPKSFRKYSQEIKEYFDKSYIPSLLNDLNDEIPDRQQQIIALLQSYGKTDRLWSAYTVYENVPGEILMIFETKEIIAAYLNSDRNYKTRKGLGRFLFSYEFKKTRRKQLKGIEQEVIDDLEKCFKHLGDKGGILAIEKLNRDRNRK